MARRCDHCDQPATVHETLIKDGVAQEIHLCAEHARAHGFVIPGSGGATVNISQLLNAAHAANPTSRRAAPRPAKTCASCGMTVTNLQATGLLGCPECYGVFEELLSGLIARAQGGASVHVGRHPEKAASSIDRAALRNRLARELRDAVSREEYERAARLRDRLSSLGTPEADDLDPNFDASSQS